jgi:HlyD family secretion protein
MHTYQSPIRAKSASALCLLLLAAGCASKEPEPAESVAPVQDAPVVRTSIQRVVRARGILYAVDQATVLPKISAPVRQFFVNRGARVKKGQLLAELENRDLAASAAESKGLLDQAEASYRGTVSATLPEEITRAQAEVQSTKEALDAAQRVLDSRKALLDQGALPRRQVEEANVAFVQARSQYEVAVKHLNALEQVGKDADIRQAQAQVDAAKARNQAAEVQLSYSRILSPIDGVIADRPLYPGEMAGPDKPLLTVMDVSRVVARANIPAEQLHYLKVGDPATITAPDVSEEIMGKVSVVSPALDANSTTAEVWVEAPNPEGRFKPGASAQVSILAATVPDALVIPLAGILPAREGAEIVMVVGPDSLAHERPIETDIREGDKVQVLKGLNEGERVIVVGGLGLEDKAKVKVEKPGEKTDEKGEKKSGQKTEK